MKCNPINLATVSLLLGATAMACTVPVFRYALDHWPADSYRLEAPAGWTESTAGQTLKKLLDESQTPLDVVPMESDGPTRLLMPGEQATVVWSGSLEDSAADLFRSPGREEVVKRLLEGESMVWVMVTSGEAAKDEEFEQRLKARLKYLGSVAAIPEQDPSDPESQLGPGPELRVGFSFLKLARDDAREQIFMKMLAGPDGDGLLADGAPFAGVIFGRARVLGAWKADELDDEGIDEVSLFLLGACSCRVKFQNPGWDLGVAVDWEMRLTAAQMAADRKYEEAAGTDPIAEDPAPAVAVAVEPEVVTFSGKETPGNGAEVAAATPPPYLLIAGVAATVAIVVAAIMFGLRKVS